jgi:phage replication-related protein YjqB (UPF0714/DUF867 family)
MPQPKDTYANYAELALRQTEGQDYVLTARQRSSPVAVVAPHGGGIEAGTADLADATAGPEHSFYAFRGVKPGGNGMLHITSHRFDEPIGLRIVGRAEVAVALHGHHDRISEFVAVGGRNGALKERIRQSLAAAGFDVAEADQTGLQAKHPQNLCNRCRSGRGVQLEISRALREKMFDRLFPNFGRSRTGHFFRFVNALRAALQ